MDRYIYVKSDESTAYFSDNESYRFRVQLDAPLILNGSWRIALTEFYAEMNPPPSRSRSPRVRMTDAVYIYTDLCKESIVHGEERSMLRRLDRNTDDGWDYMLDTYYYLPVTKKEVREFTVYIKRGDGSNATDLKQPVHLTLHLKQYPFYL